MHLLNFLAQVIFHLLDKQYLVRFIYGTISERERDK